MIRLQDRMSHYLIHANRSWKKHKYVAKVQTYNGTYRYFYSTAAYQAYLKNLSDSDSDIEDVYTSLNTAYDNTATDDESVKAAQELDKEFDEYDNNLYDNETAESKATTNKVKTWTDDTGDMNGSAYTNNAKYTVNTSDSGKLKTTLDNTINKYSNTKSEIVSDNKTRLQRDLEHKYIAKVNLGNGKWRYFYDSDEYANYLKRQSYSENESDILKDLPKTEDASASAIDDALNVNPHYSWSHNADVSQATKDYNDGKITLEEGRDIVRQSYAYTNNCAECTTTYELRRRGYDVEVNPIRAKNTRLFKDLDCWKNAKIVKIKNTSISKFDTVIEKNSSALNRGNLMVTWKSGGGHSMAYEIDTKGKLHIYDTQTGTERSTDYIKSHCSNVYFCRTDNLEPTEEVLSCVQASKH